MKRRTFIAGLGGAVAGPLVARAQQAAVPVVGWLDSQSPETEREVLPVFRKGLAETGYVEGRNVIVEYRWGTITTGCRGSPPTWSADAWP